MLNSNTHSLPSYKVVSACDETRTGTSQLIVWYDLSELGLNVEYFECEEVLL